MILSSCLMLEFINKQKEADKIYEAVTKVIKENKIKTPDMGGSNNTNDITNEIIHKL